MIIKNCIKFTEISDEELSTLKNISISDRNALLNEAFEQNPNPNPIEFIDLASKTGSDVYTVRAWFRSERQVTARRVYLKKKGKLPKQFVYMSKRY